MRLDPAVEAAHKIAYETVQIGRIRGLTNAEAMREAAKMLTRTPSRIWTLLYRSDTLASIRPAEIQALKRGFVAVLRVYEAALLDKANHQRRLAEAARQLERASILPDHGEAEFDRLLEQAESVTRIEWGYPLWRRVTAKQRPRNNKPCSPTARPAADARSQRIRLVINNMVDDLRWPR